MKQGLNNITFSIQIGSITEREIRQRISDLLIISDTKLAEYGLH